MALEVKKLSFYYGSEFEIDKISLNVKGGEITTLLGPNGSGKTTLLKCISMILKPKDGCVFVDGKNITQFTEKERAMMLGYVPQTHNPLFAYRVIDFVLLGRTPYISFFSQPSEVDFKKAEEMLKLVDLYHLKDRLYTEISGGERQLLLIARALTQEPKVLILDEPTSHLDLKNKLKVISIIKNIIKEKGICVVMSHHDPSLALRFSDKVVMLKEGNIVAVGKAEEVINTENIAKVFGVKAEIINVNGNKIVYPIGEVGKND